VEQRIGSSSKPLDGAGTDPAFIPGLTSPVSATEPEDAAPDDLVSGQADTVEDAAPEVVDTDEERDGTPEKEPEPTPDGPVFEASDRRAKIVADRRGVRLRLDDQECEFRWDEIGAVETATARLGKRFTVTVHTPERRWYPIEIEADSRARFPEWEARLDAVLDAYFEDGAEKPAAPEKVALEKDAPEKAED